MYVETVHICHRQEEKAKKIVCKSVSKSLVHVLPKLDVKLEQHKFRVSAILTCPLVIYVPVCLIHTDTEYLACSNNLWAI